MIDKYDTINILKGTFKQTKQEGYESILTKLDVNILKRKAALASTPVMEITEDGGRWKIISKTILASFELNFEIGVPFEHTTGNTF